MTDSQTTAQPQGGNGLAIASLVLGILSVLTAWIPIIGMVAWILAPLGLIFGFISVGKPTGRGIAIGGLVSSGLGLLICILWVIGMGAIMNEAAKQGAFDEPVISYEAPPADPSADQPAADTPASDDAGAGPTPPPANN